MVFVGGVMSFGSYWSSKESPSTWCVDDDAVEAAPEDKGILELLLEKWHLPFRWWLLLEHPGLDTRYCCLKGGNFNAVWRGEMLAPVPEVVNDSVPVWQAESTSKKTERGVNLAIDVTILKQQLLGPFVISSENAIAVDTLQLFFTYQVSVALTMLHWVARIDEFLASASIWEKGHLAADGWRGDKRTKILPLNAHLIRIMSHEFDESQKRSKVKWR